MNAIDFMRNYGQAETERVAKAAGTTLAYFRQIAYGHRRPSPDLAERLEIASEFRIDFRSLLSIRRKSATNRNEGGGYEEAFQNKGVNDQ